MGRLNRHAIHADFKIGLVFIIMFPLDVKPMSPCMVNNVLPNVDF